MAGAAASQDHGGDPAPDAPKAAQTLPGPAFRAGASGTLAQPEDSSPAPEPAAPPARLSAEPPKTPQARDIRLEVESGDRRVEVRLMDRAGELHVAVRTPDSRLSGALRDNLPALSSRLEQAGYRAENWQTASSDAGERRVETPASPDGRLSDQRHSADQDSRQQQRNPQPQNPEFSEQPNRKQKGSQFSWLMSSLG